MVVSKLGAGRAGCFCSLLLAYELMTATGEPKVPDAWRQDTNILDQVQDCKLIVFPLSLHPHSGPLCNGAVYILIKTSTPFQLTIVLSEQERDHHGHRCMLLNRIC